jgi:ferrous iron transport protein A
MTTTLKSLATGAQAVVQQIHGGQMMRQRLQGVGIHPGDTITVIRSGFMGGPVLIGIHGAQIAIGQRQAQRIEVEVPDPA